MRSTPPGSAAVVFDDDHWAAGDHHDHDDHAGDDHNIDDEFLQLDLVVHLVGTDHDDGADNEAASGDMSARVANLGHRDDDRRERRHH